MSLARTLEISAKVRKFALSVAAIASDAFSRIFSSGVLEQVERRLQRHFGAVDLETQRGDGLVEQAVPGGMAGDRLLVEQLLDPVFELERLFAAQVLDPRPVMGQRRLLHRPRQRRIVEPVQFKLEEQQVGRGGGDLVLRVAVKFRPDRIDGVFRIGQPGEGHDFRDQVVDRLIARDGVVKLLAARRAGQQAGERAAIAGGEFPAFTGRPLQILGK